MDGQVETFPFEVMVKYVRREIRNTTDAQRGAFFDAMAVVYATPQADGENAYGRKFRSIERLVAEHLRGAAAKECDHWHDDAGIMTHHVAFTLEMEQSLQSVNPSTTIPYWDYTIDEYELAEWVDSPIFADDWFGEASPSDQNHIVTKGRWGYTSVTTGALETSPRNPYGLLRAPWNTNPVPYVLRHRYVLGEKDGGWKFPGCSAFAMAWNATGLSSYLVNLNGFLHGPVHVMIGGQWFADPDYNVTWTQGGNYLLASKWLWRQGYVRCPEVCSSDTPSSACVCSCPDEVTAGFASAYDFLDKTGIVNMTNGMLDKHNWRNYLQFTNSSASGFSCESMDECYEHAKDLLCHVGHAGEMFTSAAPWDPTFWPIHGLADRYLAFKRMKARDNETTLEQTWAYQHVGSVPSDTGRVCDWDGVEGMALPSCERATCPGHHEDDLLPMSNFLGLNETYTNMEFYDLMDPNSDDLPYTYETFDVYPACTAQNVSFWEDGWSISELEDDGIAVAQGGGHHPVAIDP